LGEIVVRRPHEFMTALNWYSLFALSNAKRPPALLISCVTNAPGFGKALETPAGVTTAID